MRQLWVHLILLFGVGLTARLAMVAHIEPEYAGMTKSYVSAAYMMAAGYGFVRPIGEASDDELAAFAKAEGLENRQLSRQNRPARDLAQLQPMDFRLPGYPFFYWMT